MFLRRPFGPKFQMFSKIWNRRLPIVTFYFSHSYILIQKLTSFLFAFFFYRLGCHLFFFSFFVLAPIIMIHCSTKNYSAATSKSCVRLHFLTKKLLSQTFAPSQSMGLTLCHYWIRAIKHNFYSFLWHSIAGKFNQNAQRIRDISGAWNNHAVILVVPDK